MNDQVDKAPRSMAELEARAVENRKLSGFGLDTTSHQPCPFCAAPDFMVWKILEVEEVISRSTTCRECGRSARAVVTTHYGENEGIVLSKSIELIQTGGPDQPDWLRPQIRRAA